MKSQFLLPVMPGVYLGLSLEQRDRLTEGTPETIRSEKLDRYLTAMEQFLDTRDALRRIGVHA